MATRAMEGSLLNPPQAEPSLDDQMTAAVARRAGLIQRILILRQELEYVEQTIVGLSMEMRASR
jgi:hypothetical protein